MSHKQQAKAALTHPTTVIAVGALLLNDYVLKQIWHDSWITGKLSDLAWVVFASPLLAFLLSLVVRDNAAGRRAAWIASYFGLPLLYAAYNTFEPLHDWIMQGFSLAHGGGYAFPFDPTDSIVIPFGVGIALWIWRSSSAMGRSAIRIRTALLVAAVASMATVATSSEAPPRGVTSVGALEDGTLVAKVEISWRAHFYTSVDGGLVWGETPSELDPADIDWGQVRVASPEGEFAVSGTKATYRRENDTYIVYSSIVVSEEGDAVLHHAAHRDAAADTTTLQPSIYYHDATGNIVAAHGGQGVAVRTPDGSWRRVAVGDYSPTDYSLGNRLRVVARQLWLEAFIFTLGVISFSIVFAYFDHRISVRAKVVMLIVAAPLAMAVHAPQLIDEEELLTGAAVLSVTAIMLWTIMLGAVIAVTGTASPFTRMWSAVINASLSVSVSSFFVLNIYVSLHNAVTSNLSIIFVGFLVLPLLAAILASVSARVPARLLPRIFLAWIAMNCLIVLSFFIWISGGVDLSVAKILAIIATGTIALILWNNLRRVRQMEALSERVPESLPGQPRSHDWTRLNQRGDDESPANGSG